MTSTTRKAEQAKADQAKASQTAKPAAAATKPAATKPAAKSEPKQMNQCGCGCGQAVKGRFAQGHDARHCSQLRQAYEAGSLTRAKALAQVAFSDKLTAKLTRSLDLADERKAAAAAKTADAKTSK